MFIPPKFRIGLAGVVQDGGIYLAPQMAYLLPRGVCSATIPRGVRRAIVNSTRSRQTAPPIEVKLTDRQFLGILVNFNKMPVRRMSTASRGVEEHRPTHPHY
jgi:hypothetical protein